MSGTVLSRCAALCVSALLITSLGCHISSRGKDGKEDVNISTPLGGLAVKTDPAAVLGKIGVPAYPGAVSAKEDRADKDSADVDLSFGSFRMRVLALSFQTGDDPAKVEAFYRKALAQYSDVIACRDETPVGEPTRTGLGLTCKGDRHVHVSDSGKHRNDDSNDLTLKAGSSSRQHIVALRPEQGGTHFTLVALDLPSEHHSD